MIRTDWLARAAGIGDEVHVATAEHDLHGRFEEIDDSGRLMLRLPDGRIEAVPAGDVFPLAVEAR